MGTTTASMGRQLAQTLRMERCLRKEWQMGFIKLALLQSFSSRIHLMLN